MKSNISLIAFGTFGIPNGFRQSIFLGDKDNFSKIKTFDLNTNAIQLFPKSKIYAIRKEIVNGNRSIAYSLYSFAKEKNSNRGGTFIGASILFYDKIANETLIKNCLDEFHHDLINNKNNINDQVIQVHHSEELKIAKKPKDFDKLDLNGKDFGEIDFSTKNKDLLIYEVVKPELLQKALILLNVYDNIFFTNNPDIAKFTHEKQLIRLVQNYEGLATEIETFNAFKEEERKQKIKQAIARVEREIVQFEEGKLQYLQKNNRLIDVCRQQVRENDLQIKNFSKQYESDNQQIQNAVNQLEEIHQQLDQYSETIQISLQKLQNLEAQPDDISKQMEKNRAALEEAKGKLKIPDIVKLSDLKPRINTSSSNHFSQHNYPRNDYKQPSEKSSSRGTMYFVIVLLLLVAISACIFFFFFYDDSSFTFYR